ncbi:MAG: SurA N-terminal domain-containing protein [Nitrospirota bacterium]
MLQSMRKHAKYFYFLFFLVILSFIFWGVGTVDQQTSVTVAEIGKEKIDAEEFWRTYERMRGTLRELYKGQFTEEMEKNMKLKETVLNNLVEERVLLVAAHDLGLTVTDKELQEVITSDPNFMRDGIFRKDVYFRTLELNRLTPEAFENMLRRQLLAAKMRQLIASSVEVNPTELKNLPPDPAQADAARQSMLMEKQSAAVRSYVDGLKQRMNVKVNTDILS